MSVLFFCNKTSGGDIMKKILVIFDSSDMLTVLREFFKQYGLFGLFAMEKKRGLEFFEENREEIKVVIIGTCSPEMMGLELAAEIKRLNSSVYVILIGANDDAEFTKEVMKNLEAEDPCINDFRAIPFSSSEFTESLKNTLQKM
jgi:DNA-binding NtrC family response regulator